MNKEIVIKFLQDIIEQLKSGSISEDSICISINRDTIGISRGGLRKVYHTYTGDVHIEIDYYDKNVNNVNDALQQSLEAVEGGDKND
ncbi:MAG: hypothetical protein ACLFUH_05840 [Bacteroidales bacterium]